MCVRVESVAVKNATVVPPPLWAKPRMFSGPGDAPGASERNIPQPQEPTKWMEVLDPAGGSQMQGLHVTVPLESSWTAWKCLRLVFMAVYFCCSI